MNADSWGAMTAALDYLEDHSSDTLYDELFFRIGVQYQYPPSALLLIEPFHAAGIATRRVLNSVNFVLYLLNAAVLSTLAVRLAGNLPRLVIRWGYFSWPCCSIPFRRRTTWVRYRLSRICCSV